MIADVLFVIYFTFLILYCIVAFHPKYVTKAQDILAGVETYKWLKQNQKS